MAYVNHGRWIADCPIDCGGAQELDNGQTMFACKECYQMSEVEWPKDPGGIWEALAKRVNPKNRNWYPKGQPVAVKANLPQGQSVKDLLDEQAAEEAESWPGQPL